MLGNGLKNSTIIYIIIFGTHFGFMYSEPKEKEGTL